MAETPAQASVLLDATRGGVAILTLNRPLLHNAMNPEIVDELAEKIDELKGADGVRCVILEAAGANFSAGDDAEWTRFVADYTHDDHISVEKALSRMLLAWRNLPQPTLALVHGAAIGIGAGLVAAADIAIADRSAVFAFPDVRLGVMPAAVTPFVIEALGARMARRYIVTGERFDANEALRIGLVHVLVDDRQGLAAASEDIVSSLYASAPGAIKAAKDLITAAESLPFDQHLAGEVARRLAERRASAEAREGLTALLEHRKPAWSQ